MQDEKGLPRCQAAASLPIGIGAESPIRDPPTVLRTIRGSGGTWHFDSSHHAITPGWALRNYPGFSEVGKGRAQDRSKEMAVGTSGRGPTYLLHCLTLRAEASICPSDFSAVSTSRTA